MIEQTARIGLTEAASRAGISTRRAHEWHRRFNEAGTDGLLDRSSRPHAHPRTTTPEKHERVINLRSNQRLPYAEIARRVGVSTATAGRICKRAGLVKLPPVEAAPVRQRYERKTPGEILHMDIKKLACFGKTSCKEKMDSMFGAKTILPDPSGDT